MHSTDLSTSASSLGPHPNGTVQTDLPAKIDLVEIFYLFWGHAIHIILTGILVAALAFGYTKVFIQPLYQSTAKIYIVSASSGTMVDIGDLQLGSQLTADYRELMLSRPVLEDIIASLDLSLGYSSLRGMIGITNPSDTRFLNITVTSTDPEMSSAVANEMVRQCMIYMPEVLEVDMPNVVEYATPSYGSISPDYARNICLGFLAGAVLCCGILLIRFLLNDSLSSPEDVARRYGVQPLACIPEGDFGSFNRKLSTPKTTSYWKKIGKRRA